MKRGSKYPSQAEIVDLMRNGWELGTTDGINSRAWMQEGGLGRGGQAKEVHGNTFYSLLRNRVIRRTGSHGIGSRYELVDI